jgi:predicted dehydrogenase
MTTSRRGFVAASLAFSASRVWGANERLRLGIIGPGDRGQQIMKDALACPNVEFVGAADIYTRRLEQVRRIVPEIKTYLDYRSLLDDKTIDAVLIATPQHLHCEHFVASIGAGKHVYQEKTMAFTVEHAKRMRAAYQQASGRVVQVGHQHVSSGLMKDALAMLASEPMGKITMIEMEMYRNTPHGHPQWARPIWPDATQENILWEKFLGEAPRREFDANRYVNWRFFWDYSGGNVYENMCHQICFWYKALKLKIPKAVTMRGGVYLWKDGREVPDTMTVTLEQPEEMLISWNSCFGNDDLGYTDHVLGDEGTMHRTDGIRWLPQKVNVKDREEKKGTSTAPPGAHMLNFVETIRNGGEPNCPFELGFRVSIACRMSVESYRQGRTVQWDADKEEIV